jgi:uncharacterized protein (DUF885 family)
MTFTRLAAEFLQEEYADAPVLATHLGVPGHDDRLDDLSEAAFAARRRRAEAWLARFRAVPDAGLDGDARIDRDLLVSVLTGRTLLADWEMWRRQPATYLGPGLDGVFSLWLHRMHPEAELTRAAGARLRAIPRCLAEGRRNLAPELVPRVYVERAVGQARAGARYVGELLPREVRDLALQRDLAEAGSTAATALTDFAEFLQGLAARAHGPWAIGETRYSRLLRERELLADDARGLRERGRREYERLAEELGRCARALDGTDDWPAVLHRLNQDHPTTPDAMREAYAEWTTRARAFLVARDLVSLPPGEECRIVPSPPFQRPVLAVASYQSPPAFSSSLRGHFFVPFPPDGASPAEVQARLSNNSYPSMATTSVHEAYPGHHWHLVTMKAHPSPVRQTFRSAYFTEGWALYAEQMMREQGFFTDPRQVMCQHEAMLLGAARIVVDTSLHLGEMTFEEAVTFMRERANLPEPTARAEVGRYASWPTQAAAYLTGCLEILRMRERWLGGPGPGDPAALRPFHDRLAGSGGLPLALAERALFQAG